MSAILTYPEAVILGAFQGVTELFPVSSLGHSVLIPALVGGSWKSLDVTAKDSPYLAFIVGMHVCTAIAMIIYFWQDWLRIIRGFFGSFGQIASPAPGTGRFEFSNPDSKLAWMIILGTIPVGIAGVILDHPIRTQLAKPIPTAIFLTLNGLLLYGGERLRRHRKGLDDEQSVTDRAAVSAASDGWTSGGPGQHGPSQHGPSQHGAGQVGGSRGDGRDQGGYGTPGDRPAVGGYGDAGGRAAPGRHGGGRHGGGYGDAGAAGQRGYSGYDQRPNSGDPRRGDSWQADGSRGYRGDYDRGDYRQGGDQRAGYRDQQGYQQPGGYPSDQWGAPEYDSRGDHGGLGSRGGDSSGFSNNPWGDPAYDSQDDRGARGPRGGGFGDNQWNDEQPASGYRGAQPGGGQYGEAPPAGGYRGSQYDPDQYDPDQYGAGQHGADQHGADQYRGGHHRDQYGADQHGADRYSADRYGADRYGADRYGADRYGADEYRGGRPGAGQRDRDSWADDQRGYRQQGGYDQHAADYRQPAADYPQGTGSRPAAPPVSGQPAAQSRSSKQHEADLAVQADRRLARLSWVSTVALGASQILALFPGFSRDGSVMVSGLLRGLSRQDAVRFSFLLSAPVIFAAGAFKASELFSSETKNIHGPIIAGSLVAGVCAYFALMFLDRFLSNPKRTLTPFAVYCLVMGIGSLIYLH